VRNQETECADFQRIDAVDPLRSAGDVDRLVEVIDEDTNDLAETEGDDCQIIAAESQRRKAEQHAEAGGDQRANRQQHPERPVQAEVRRGEEAEQIGSDRVEGDVAEVEQAGKTDHQIQAEREQHIDQREIQDPDPGVGDGHRDERGGKRDCDNE
jgi:hypothetical protein